MKRIEHGMATVLVVALASALAACGGSDAPSKQTATPADASAAAQPGKDAAAPPATPAASAQTPDAKSDPNAAANPRPSDAPASDTSSDKPVQSSYYARQQQPASGTSTPPEAAASIPPAAPPSTSAAPPPIQGGDAGARYANVISVQPVKQTGPHEECQDVRVVHRHKPKDDNQIAGTVIGAVAGGVLGHQVGGGRGRDLATVAGAVGGGIAGKKIQENQQNQRTYTTTERRCRKVDGPSEQVVAYDVVYEYLGSTHQVRLDHDPGDRVELPVRGIE
jgi:uncharacterized protein YcfJ